MTMLKFFPYLCFSKTADNQTMQEDYIIRIIKDVAKVLAIALDLFKNDKPDEALALADETLKKTFGLATDFDLQS